MNEIYILSEKVYEGARNLPVIVIRYMERKCLLKDYEALIFSSKNGVKAIDRINPEWRRLPSYSIGSGTSEEIRKRGGNVVYEAKSSYGDDFAKEIRERLKGKRALFLRAKVVTSSLNEILRKNGVLLDECIVYETRCNDCQKLSPPPAGAIIIFSSPSTINCFFRCFEWRESYTAVVIGTRTAASMPGEISYHLSPKPTIPACIEFAKRLSEKGV